MLEDLRGLTGSRRLLGPAAVLVGPIMPLGILMACERAPSGSRLFERGLVEQVEGAVKGQRGVTPLAVGNQDIAGAVGSVGARRHQHRLARILTSACHSVRKEAPRSLVPENSV